MYNELPQELLDLQVPHLFPQEQHTQAHELAEAAPLHRAPTGTRNNTNPEVRLLKYKMKHFVLAQGYNHSILEFWCLQNI